MFSPTFRIYILYYIYIHTYIHSPVFVRRFVPLAHIQLLKRACKLTAKLTLTITHYLPNSNITYHTGALPVDDQNPNKLEISTQIHTHTPCCWNINGRKTHQHRTILHYYIIIALINGNSSKQYERNKFMTILYEGLRTRKKKHRAQTTHSRTAQ